jgi:hypothetical protein
MEKQRRPLFPFQMQFRVTALFLIKLTSRLRMRYVTQVDMTVALKSRSRRLDFVQAMHHEL